MSEIFKCECGREFKLQKELNYHRPHCRTVIGEEEYIRRCKVRSDYASNTTTVHKGNTEKRIKKELLDEYLNDGWEFGLSDYHKQKDRESVSGKNNPMYGKKHTPETCKKISDSLSDSKMAGENNPMYGVDRSGETHCCYGRIKIYKDDVNSTCYPDEFSELERQGWKRGVCERTRKITSQNTKEGQAGIDFWKSDGNKRWRSSYYKNVLLRSSYEAFYVIYAIYHNINLEFASNKTLTLYNEDGSVEYNYHPDFYLPDSNTIVETNNGSRPDLLVLREKVTKSYGYNWKLILGPESDEEYNELLNAGINVDELWERLYNSTPNNRVHWDFVNNKVIFLDKEDGESE